VSTSNLPTTMPSIQRLLQRISSAEKTNQKEIRITIQEARELTTDLALLTSRLGTTVQEVHTMLRKMKAENEELEVKFDGGDF
jgi:septation ring formation regulator EzrA|tara:strand:+ start:712 stop:960 length:249 start_codon:yes stop_codon:yes gene_type:complete